jgi:hypothetical protein
MSNLAASTPTHGIVSIKLVLGKEPRNPATAVRVISVLLVTERLCRFACGRRFLAKREGSLTLGPGSPGSALSLHSPHASVVSPGVTAVVPLEVDVTFQGSLELHMRSQMAGLVPPPQVGMR